MYALTSRASLRRQHGVLGITKAMSNEWASKGVNVNAIAPGKTRFLCFSPLGTEDLLATKPKIKPILRLNLIHTVPTGYIKTAMNDGVIQNPTRFRQISVSHLWSGGRPSLRRGFHADSDSAFGVLFVKPLSPHPGQERIPQGRWGKPEDFEGLAVFLCSSASDYITGECVLCDGGWMAR